MSRKDSNGSGSSSRKGKAPAVTSPSPVKRKSSSFSHKSFESGVKSPKATDENSIVLTKIEEFASKDVFAKGSGDCLFSKGDKTAERVHVVGGNSAVKGLYVGLQEVNGVGENDRPEIAGIMSVLTICEHFRVRIVVDFIVVGAPPPRFFQGIHALRHEHAQSACFGLHDEVQEASRRVHRHRRDHRE